MKKIIQTTVLLSTLFLSNLNAKSGDIYAGLEWYGLSVKYDATDKVTAQIIGGLWGYSNILSVTTKGIYKFKERNYYTLYGYGALTSWAWDNGVENETVLGFGAGGGVEYDLRGLDREFIPLFVSADIGLQVAKFNHYRGFNGVGLEFGIHYKF